MIDKYKLEDNDWLKGLYEERERWIPAFTKRYFLAGMFSSQRSESMNSYFDDYINQRTSLKQFVQQYEKALKKKIKKESKADFDSFNTNVPLVSKLYMENQIRAIYTNTMFMKFQEEIKDLMYCSPVVDKQDGAIVTFVVRDWKNVIDDEGNIRREHNYEVIFNPEKIEAHCVCRGFEFRGILCRHILCVFMDHRITKIPPHYILTRWRKDMKRPHNFVSCSYDDLGDNNRLVRYNHLYTLFNEAADIGSESEYLCDRAKSYITDMVGNLLQEKESVDGQQTTKTEVLIENGVDENEELEQTHQKVLSPLKVKRKGRPKEKIIMSNIEKSGGSTKKQVQKTKSTCLEDNINEVISKRKYTKKAKTSGLQVNDNKEKNTTMRRSQRRKSTRLIRFNSPSNRKPQQHNFLWF